jgi:hypothetical protein
MKNNIKLNVISVAIGLLSYNNLAQAAWLTIDPANIAQTTISAANSVITAAQTMLTKQATAINGQKIDQTNTQLDVLTQQSVNNELDADIRRRVSGGTATMAEIANKMVPTLAACVQASASVTGSPKGAAGSAANKSSGGGSQGGPKRSTEVVSTATAQANVLKEQKELGTCAKELMGTAACPTNTPAKYEKGDMQPRGIKGNIESLPNDGSQEMFNNYTFSSDGTGFKVAQKYAADMAYYDKPKVPTPEQLKKNPAYAASYHSVQTKLDAAHDSIIDILRQRRPSETDVSSTAPGKIWADVSNSDYKKVTGLKTKPGNKPSLFEMLNYEIRNDYLGNKDAKLDSTEEVNKRLALNNFIAWSQYQQQENTNILLSHILVQLTTPVNKGQVDNEFQKTMSAK